MLNLFKLNTKKNKILVSKDKKILIKVQEKSLKHFPSSTREWNNSIYLFNKNALKLIPVAANDTIKLIKDHFNVYNNHIERKLRKERLLLRLRRLSSNKIFISNGEFKHTNNKLIITLYLFNRQKYNYKRIMKKQYFKYLFKSMKNTLSKKFNIISNKGFKALIKINKKKIIVQNLHKNIDMYKYLTDFYKQLVKRCLSKLKTYLMYKQLVYTNKSKFNYVYLQFLKKYIEKIYNKNIEFNLVNLKRFYLNSDIMSETMKLKITKNRKKILKYFNNLKKKVKIQKKNWLLYDTPNSKFTIKQNENKTLIKFAINNLKYKHITGFRLEAKGRITRRYTASRSAFKLRYKGNLMNIDSSFRGLSSITLKGNLRSNVQYTKLKSKTRIGSFGIKGWISSD